MKGQGLVLGLLLGVLGSIHCQSSGSRRVCSLPTAIPCINGAIVSFVRNTKGQAAASRPADTATTLLVAQTMTTSLYNPDLTDLNTTCQVLTNIDTDAMVQCLRTASKRCTFQPPPTLSPDTLPSLARYTIIDTADLSEKLCTTECKDFPLTENIATMKECQRTYESAMVDVDQANLTESSELCNLTETYLHCVWNQSVGCPFLEFTSHSYVRLFDETLNTCRVTVLPPEEPEEVQPELTTEGPDTLTSSASTLTSNMPHMVVHWILLTNFLFLLNRICTLR